MEFPDSGFADLKRKRSPSNPSNLSSHTGHANHAQDHHGPPPPKTAKTHNHLQINYLARQFTDDLPLASADESLPSLLTLLGEYQGVLDRHESMACNLGARPLGPILIKRFERLFDGPPRVLKSHAKDSTTVTWLDVVEFARNKPEQFTLGQMSEGVRVCQFYTKQCRVQISEEDFVLISSGIPQKMIPPQPIMEDEEKELGTIDILEKNLGQICQLADQVAARTRQLNHRLKGRRQAILDRRNTESPSSARPPSPTTASLLNGSLQAAGNVLASLNQASSHPSPSGFVAVNRPNIDSNPQAGDAHKNGASSATRSELLTKFQTVNERRGQANSGEFRRLVNPNTPGSPTSTPSSTHKALPPSSSSSIVHPPSTTPLPPSSTTALPSGPSPSRSQLVGNPHSSSYLEAEQLHQHSTSPVPIPGTPASLLPQHSTRATPIEKDDGGPFKADMVLRMENLGKGQRVIPPCDRCRRLHMDCLKNLTACMGCTKKHAKCSWREVKESEIRALELASRSASNAGADSAAGLALAALSASGKTSVNAHGPGTTGGGSEMEDTAGSPVSRSTSMGSPASVPRASNAPVARMMLGESQQHSSLHDNLRHIGGGGDGHRADPPHGKEPAPPHIDTRPVEERLQDVMMVNAAQGRVGVGEMHGGLATV